MEPKQKRGRWIVLGVVVGLVVAWGGFTVADAVIPAPGGVIKGCYKKNGNLRVIDSAASCKAGKEKAIQWNQTGPAGPAGGDNTLFAYVLGSGELGQYGNKGAIGATQFNALTGTQVIFDRDVSGCAYSVTHSSTPGAHLFTSVHRGEIFDLPSNYVSVWNENTSGERVNVDFYLTVVC